MVRKFADFELDGARLELRLRGRELTTSEIDCG
jgi:hypothetical protein